MHFICIQKMETQASKLCQKYRDRAKEIELKKQAADDSWETLEDLSDARFVQLSFLPLCH